MKIEIEIPENEIEAYNENRPIICGDIKIDRLQAVAEVAVNEYIANRWIEVNKSKYNNLISGLEEIGHYVEVRPNYLDVNGAIIGIDSIIEVIYNNREIVIVMTGKKITFTKRGGIKATFY